MDAALLILLPVTTFQMQYKEGNHYERPYGKF